MNPGLLIGCEENSDQCQVQLSLFPEESILIDSKALAWFSNIPALLPFQNSIKWFDTQEKILKLTNFEKEPMVLGLSKHQSGSVLVLYPGSAAHQINLGKLGCPLHHSNEVYFRGSTFLFGSSSMNDIQECRVPFRRTLLERVLLTFVPYVMFKATFPGSVASSSSCKHYICLQSNHSIQEKALKEGEKFYVHSDFILAVEGSCSFKLLGNGNFLSPFRANFNIFAPPAAMNAPRDPEILARERLRNFSQAGVSLPSYLNILEITGPGKVFLSSGMFQNEDMLTKKSYRYRIVLTGLILTLLLLMIAELILYFTFNEKQWEMFFSRF